MGDCLLCSQSIFFYAADFNQNIGGWDVSAATGLSVRRQQRDAQLSAVMPPTAHSHAAVRATEGRVPSLCRERLPKRHIEL